MNSFSPFPIKPLYAKPEYIFYEESEDINGTNEPEYIWAIHYKQ